MTCEPGNRCPGCSAPEPGGRCPDAGTCMWAPAKPTTRAEFIEKLRRDVEARAHAAADGFKFIKLPQQPVNPMADRLRWAAVLQAVAGTWRWEISGGRGHIGRVVVQEPPDSKRLNIEIRVDL